MPAQLISFSANRHFTGLDPASPGPQAATLVWELENDPTLSAAGLLVRSDTILVEETEPADNGQTDQIVSLQFNRENPPNTFTPQSWQELSQAEQDAVLAVFAAHEGKVTRADEQSVVDTSATTNPDFDPWVEKLSITTEPLTAGLYVIDASYEHKLTTNPTGVANAKSETRLSLTRPDDGLGPQNRGMDSWPFDFPHAVMMRNTFFAREGEAVTISLEHRRTGAGMISQISRARLSVKPVDGTEG